MPRHNIPDDERIRYYRALAEFWHETINLQRGRCLQEIKSRNETIADLNFYVVAIQRLREVARMMRERLSFINAGEALQAFDKRWPRFKELRDLQEHILGPHLDAPAGVTYFGEFIADLQPGGGVEYLIDAREEEATDRLYKDLCNLLAE